MQNTIIAEIVGQTVLATATTIDCSIWWLHREIDLSSMAIIRREYEIGFMIQNLPWDLRAPTSYRFV